MDAQDFLADRSDRALRTLFKGFLIILEDIHREHHINFEKLREAFPEDEDLIDMADYFDDERFSIYRKKVLDLGNEMLREYQSELENFEVKFIFKQD